MNKLEVGMYVRTKFHGIFKLYREFSEDSIDVGIGIIPEINGFFIDEKERDYVEKKDIIKASFDIIDLIEVGDYANGCKVIKNTLKDGGNIVIVQGGNCFTNDDIKTVVTKEQFESVSYKVGE